MRVGVKAKILKRILIAHIQNMSRLAMKQENIVVKV
jgi:hypothetical protein